MRKLLLRLIGFDELVKEQDRANELLEKMLKELKEINRELDISNRAKGNK